MSKYTVVKLHYTKDRDYIKRNKWERIRIRKNTKKILIIFRIITDISVFIVNIREQ